MISFKGVPGNKFAFNVIAKLDKSFNNALRKGLQQSGIRIAGMTGRANDGLIKKKMNEPKHGRIYQVSVGRKGRILKKLRAHQASRAGESPAVITGELRKSVYFKVEGANHLRIGADTPYARILELGGNAGKNRRSRIARRSYLIRPILESRRDIINDIRNAINSNIKK
jgi:phage gpG-like protein